MVNEGARPLLLDLFCGAGGAAMGYYRAGFDVIGVDVKPQPRYPFEFHQADATSFPLDGFHAIHASPPCQDHSRSYHPRENGTGWMLAAARERLAAIGIPWVIENVPGAPMRADFRLCGCMFELPRLKRERWFETSWQHFELRPPCHHPDPIVTVAGHGICSNSWYQGRVLGAEYGQLCREAMGIDWMNRDELAQAIPPAYTEHIGLQLMTVLEASRGARALCPGFASMTSFPFTARWTACRMLHTAFTPRRSSGARGTSQTVSCQRKTSTA